MKEMFFAVVVTVFGVVNIWLVNVHAKKIDEVFVNIRRLNQQLCDLELQTRKLKYNPAILKAEREKEIETLESKLKALEEYDL
ncbi:hypothetical protein KJR06_04865 [Streptococcus lutetiensis]|uniref:hypothetical protein n=1 Tax=Streptococcus lutetiensis TaxID=150055 RepID=UPI00117F6D12|nr:hypothetical protein [Streptococcus lutetiensis]MBD8956114.1 hypothetical protein [Streptococcus lutetiensis]MBT0891689.1 hypothetical protein [Streptococcus lutetiensis]MBT0901311.1 hypothetical protein [Streptococcus lutetiensis]MBT0905718.1 hypothetical protein [Streptococcus lutetiensis]MBT0947635.1 hypothetical protein [Streptococcus lutetiensis]